MTSLSFSRFKRAFDTSRNRADKFILKANQTKHEIYKTVQTLSEATEATSDSFDGLKFSLEFSKKLVSEDFTIPQSVIDSCDIFENKFKFFIYASSGWKHAHEGFQIRKKIHRGNNLSEFQIASNRHYRNQYLNKFARSGIQYGLFLSQVNIFLKSTAITVGASSAVGYIAMGLIGISALGFACTGFSIAKNFLSKHEAQPFIKSDRNNNVGSSVSVLQLKNEGEIIASQIDQFLIQLHELLSAYEGIVNNLHSVSQGTKRLHSSISEFVDVGNSLVKIGDTVIDVAKNVKQYFTDL